MALYPSVESPGIDVAGGVQVHVGGRGLRGALAEVEEVRLPLGVADQHKAAAAQVAGLRQHHGQRKARRDGGVDRVAALLQHGQPRVGGVVVDRNHHRVRRGRGRLLSRKGRSKARRTAAVPSLRFMVIPLVRELL